MTNLDRLLAELIDHVASRTAEIVLAQLAESTEQTCGHREYLTIPEAADILRCKRQRVDDLLSQGRLIRYKDGGRTLVRRAEVENYLTANARRGDTPVTLVLQSRSGRRMTR